MEQFKNIGTTLATFRKEKKLQQSDLSVLLAERGINVSNQAISKWEKGKTVPNAIQFLNLCEVLGIEDVMSCFSDGHAGILSGLNTEGRKMVTALIMALSESPQYAQGGGSEAK